MLKTYGDVLKRYAALSETGSARADERRLESLRADLRSLILRNEKFFWIWIMCLVILFGVCLGLALHFVNEPARIAQIFTGMGVGLAGVVWRIGDAWKSKMALEFTITLLGGLTEQAASSVIAVLANKLKI